MLRFTTTTTTATRVVPAALLALTLAACGSDTSTPDGDTAGADGGFDVGGATLTEEPFCDRIDTAMVGEVLEIPADNIRVQTDRQVGEEFQGPVDEAKPVTSVANLCVLGSSTSQFTVSVQPGATASDVQEVVDDLSALEGSSESCEAGEASAFGEPAAVFTCESGAPLKRVRVVATGLVGDSKFYCAATMNQGAGDDFEAKALDACSTALEELASEA